MSTSEFENWPSGSDVDPFSLSTHDHREFPEDFSEVDVTFAQELDAFFSLEEDDVPPLFAQTLLEAEDAHFQPVEPCFEKKTYARVFRRLKLERRLFRSTRPSTRTLLSRSALPRPLMALGIACMLFMVVTVIFNSTSFASGLSYLWAGAHSGVLLVGKYPHISQSSRAREMPRLKDSAPMDLYEAQHLLHFSIYEPHYLPTNYTKSSGDAYLYQESWADGPILVLNFYDTQPGITPRQISICEFKPQGTVLQVVQDGAAHEVTIGHNDLSSAIFVQGQWTQASASSPSTWVYSNRSQLISEKDGVVFWIVGDKRDGIDSNQLSEITSSLAVFNKAHSLSGRDHVNRFTEADGDDIPASLTDDVIYLNNPNNPDGLSFELVGEQPATSSPAHS